MATTLGLLGLMHESHKNIIRELMGRMMTHQELGEISHNRKEESNERRVVGAPPNLDEIVRSLMEELHSYKDDNERLIKEKEKRDRN
jgi:hypothetical protein